MGRLSHLKALPSFLQPLDKLPHRHKQQRIANFLASFNPSSHSLSCEDAWALRSFSALLRLLHKKQKQELFSVVLDCCGASKKHMSVFLQSSHSFVLPCFLACSSFGLFSAISSHSPTMESSQLTGDDGEECNSNESGWTIYLASPGSSDDFKANESRKSNVEDGSGYSNSRSKEDYRNYGEGDYDSLASDASTGPAQVKVFSGKEKKGHGKNDGSSRDEHNKDEKEETHTSCNKKVGRAKKEEKITKRGYSKRRSSSRSSFW